MVMMGSGYCKQLYALRDAVLFPTSGSGSLSSQAANSLRRTVEPVARRCRLIQQRAACSSSSDGPCRIGVVHFRDTFLLRRRGSGSGSRRGDRGGPKSSSNGSGRPFDAGDDRGGDESGSGSGGEGSEPDPEFVILDDDAYANRLTKLILGDIPARVTQFFSSRLDDEPELSSWNESDVATTDLPLHTTFVRRGKETIELASYIYGGKKQSSLPRTFSICSMLKCYLFQLTSHQACSVVSTTCDTSRLWFTAMLRGVRFRVPPFPISQWSFLNYNVKEALSQRR